jgi:hypothetical protein
MAEMEAYSRRCELQLKEQKAAQHPACHNV